MSKDDGIYLVKDAKDLWRIKQINAVENLFKLPAEEFMKSFDLSKTYETLEEATIAALQLDDDRQTEYGVVNLSTQGVPFIRKNKPGPITACPLCNAPTSES